MRIGLLTISAVSGVWLAWLVRTRGAHGKEARTLFYGILFALGITTIVQPLLPADSARWLSQSIFLGGLAWLRQCGPSIGVPGTCVFRPRPSRSRTRRRRMPALAASTYKTQKRQPTRSLSSSRNWLSMRLRFRVFSRAPVVAGSISLSGFDCFTSAP